MTITGNSRPSIHEVEVRENIGRDTIARFQSQFRAAARECLALLGDEQLERVYCDYHDDFVSRLNVNGQIVYNFYQVKTKKKLNKLWTVNELFGLLKKQKKADSEKIRNSFVGRLLIHTVKFKQSCGDVILLTNIHVDDDIEALLKAAQEVDKENIHFQLLYEKFNESFAQSDPVPETEIAALIQKLNVESNVTYLSPNDDTFSALARDQIYKFSEIDLRHGECEEIINDLVSLVEKKSFKMLIEDIDETDLDDIAGIGLEDMLDILSISKGAYNQLKSGGDPSAIKNASIIQRLLNQSGASVSMIEYVSDCKVRWDIWFRAKRHTGLEFDLNFLQEEIGKIAVNLSKNLLSMESLQQEIENLLAGITNKNLSNTLSNELLLGAVFAAVVRNESQ